ncbi:MAG: IclR family transcriptional regulator [Candidatus Woesearchaeota archaeon]
MESAERVASVLLTFTSGEPVLGVADIARRLGIPKSAVHRTLTALCRTGLVRQDPATAKYRLGMRAVDLGLAALDHGDIRSAALPIMREITSRTGETTTLSLLSGRERFYAAQTESPQDVRMTVDVGLRCPLYAGASGRAILAGFSEAELDEYLRSVALTPLTENTITGAERLRTQLARVRESGYAESQGERDPWAAAVAAAFSDRDGRVAGCLSICGPRSRFETGAARAYGPLVREAATRLTGELQAGNRALAG